MASRDREVRHQTQAAVATILLGNCESIIEQMDGQLRNSFDRSAAVREVENIAAILRAWSAGRPGKR
jgi:vacuolar-type H+-ATPase subunit C/Vma6